MTKISDLILQIKACKTMAELKELLSTVKAVDKNALARIIAEQVDQIVSEYGL